MERTATPSLRLKDFAPYALSAPRWYLPAGVLLELIAWAIVATLIYVLFLRVSPSGRVGWGTGGMLIGLPAGMLSLFMMDRGRRLRVNARKTLLAEGREPLLYLRPFYHERPGLSPSSNNGALETAVELYLELSGADGPSKATDGAIAKALQEIGPLVTVGVPREKLPPAGALRLYFPDEVWQEKVTALMSISRLVIIQPSYTASIEWEMSAARRHCRPEQVYVSFLGWCDMSKESRQVEYDVFKIQAERLYGVPLPEHSDKAYFMRFDDDWRPVEVTASRRIKALLYMSFGGHLPSLESMSTTAVREILRPALRKRGMRLSVWRTIGYVALTYALYGSLICYYVFHAARNW